MKPRHLATLAALLFITCAMSGCATTTLYRDGQPVAKFGGDMVGMNFESGADGSFKWSGDIDHSSPTKAYGIASKGRIVAAAGVATYGLSKIR